MAIRRLGTLTIGQAPRSDITPIIEHGLPARTECVHVGLLDALDDHAIEQGFGASEKERVLVTRLRSGRTVTLSAERVERALPGALEQLEARGCDVIVLLCTGAFQGLTCKRAWLIEPDRVVPHMVRAIAGERTLGVIVPLPSQIGTERVKWGSLDATIHFAAASPYEHEIGPLLAAGRDLEARGAQVLVLDCMGFVEWHRARLSDSVSVPVLLSNALVAMVTAAVVG